MQFDEFFQSATGHLPYGYQRAFATAPTVVDLLEVPTGAGKTAAAVLGWLWRRTHGSREQRQEAGRRLVFCLPMRTLVEQIERVVVQWRARLNLDPVTLGVYTLMGGAVNEEWEAFPDRDTVLIGTQDQLLSRALMRGYAMSRYRWPVHFALLNNDCTWVMDEVQLMGVGASTAAQLQAFRDQLETAGTARTVWMTATLAEDRLRTVDVRRTFSRLPFVGEEPALQERLRATKTLEKASARSGKSGSLVGLAREIAAAHQPDTLTLVVVNQVARAQELWTQLTSDKSIERVALVHSRFRPADRRRIQNLVLGGSFRGVVVATQAIEAGVDLSAKTLFTELAPWSSLVQRFGRLNRAGEHAASRAVWIDLDTDDEALCLPYQASQLIAARGRLASLADVGPTSLSGVALDVEEPTLPVIRKKDLLELFDTEPDLSGHDIDVSRYIRAADDRDVQVAWRAIGDGPPSDDAPDLDRDELCSVPLYGVRRLASQGKKIWRFDGLRDRWVEVEAERLFPGLAVVVDVSVGGYDSEAGFSGDRTHVPASLAPQTGGTPDADTADPQTFAAAEYVALSAHADDAVGQMSILVSRLGQTLGWIADKEILIDAARWHDLGKAHPAFQEMLAAGLAPDDPRRSEGPWAKSGRQGRTKNKRRFFRHELASALAWLATGRSDLGGFIVAAHHGKVRLSLRARPGELPPSGPERKRFAHGIHDGDVLPHTNLGAEVVIPEQTLSLACMELGGSGQGPSWADRMGALLEQHGPFRLAYAETLLRIADWRASQQGDLLVERNHG